MEALDYAEVDAIYDRIVSLCKARSKKKKPIPECAVPVKELEYEVNRLERPVVDDKPAV